jgi:hypothetical protein
MNYARKKDLNDIEIILSDGSLKNLIFLKVLIINNKRIHRNRCI